MNMRVQDEGFEFPWHDVHFRSDHLDLRGGVTVTVTGRAIIDQGLFVQAVMAFRVFHEQTIQLHGLRSPAYAAVQYTVICRT